MQDDNNQQPMGPSDNSGQAPQNDQPAMPQEPAQEMPKPDMPEDKPVEGGDQSGQ